MNDKYNPPAGLSNHELNVIGQSLVSDLAGAARNISLMHPDMLRFCAEHGRDAEEVRTREIAHLADRYEVVCRFVPFPLPFEFFERVARS
jgi:hypothetical protein